MRLAVRRPRRSRRRSWAISTTAPSSSSRSTPAAAARRNRSRLTASTSRLDPTIVSEPGGYLDLNACTYEAATDHATRVRASRWVPQDDYWVKIEGASLEGYRAFTLGGIRDPIAIRELDAILDGVRAHVERTLPAGTGPGDFSMRFLVYGRDGALGGLEPSASNPPHEVMVVIDVVASDPEQARSICGGAKQMMLHYFYEGILATGGNLAIPFGPDVHDGGAVYSFNVYHLVRLDDPLELFSIRRVSVS